MKTKAYFTFGQLHVHRFNGKTLDKDTVVLIESDDPRTTMCKYFGDEWSMEYENQPDEGLFPGGLVTIEE